MGPILVNQTTCKECRICGEVCPRHILEVKGTGKNKYNVVSGE